MHFTHACMHACSCSLVHIMWGHCSVILKNEMDSAQYVIARSLAASGQELQIMWVIRATVLGTQLEWQPRSPKHLVLRCWIEELFVTIPGAIHDPVGSQRNDMFRVPRQWIVGVFCTVQIGVCESLVDHGLHVAHCCHAWHSWQCRTCWHLRLVGITVRVFAARLRLTFLSCVCRAFSSQASVYCPHITHTLLTYCNYVHWIRWYSTWCTPHARFHWQL